MSSTDYRENSDIAMEVKLEDVNTYLNAMRHSVIDKLFFAAIVEPDIIVDYGCADGAVLIAYRKMFPNTKLIGYDVSSDMIRRAVVNASKAGAADIMFTDNWRDVERVVHGGYESPAILLSSVFHETKSYLSTDQFTDFWSFRALNPENFRYVLFRDMMVSKDTRRQSDQLTVARIRSSYPKDKLAEWEGTWGSLTDNHSLIHFLLTYRYVENWERELNENYLPVDVEKFIAMIPDSYRMIHFDHYTLPFLRERVREDFEIDLTERTHVKAILERR